MSKKAIELLKSVSTNKQIEFTPAEIERLADAVSNEIVKIQEKSQGVALQDNEIMKEINNLTNPSMSVYLMTVASVILPTTCLGIIGISGGFNSLFLISSGFLGTLIAVLAFISGITFIPEVEMTKNQLKNPSWFYKMMLKITPGASKKYRIAQQNYRELTLSVEAYQQYYEKKMKLIKPALDIINAHSQGITLSVDERGEIITTKTPHAQVKSKITQSINKPITPQLSIPELRNVK